MCAGKIHAHEKIRESPQAQERASEKPEERKRKRKGLKLLFCFHYRE